MPLFTRNGSIWRLATCHKNRSSTNSQKDLLRSKSSIHHSSWIFILLSFIRVIFHQIPLALMLITSATKFRPHAKVSVPMKSTSLPWTETESCDLNDDDVIQMLTNCLFSFIFCIIRQALIKSNGRYDNGTTLHGTDSLQGIIQEEFVGRDQE